LFFQLHYPTKEVKVIFETLASISSPPRAGERLKKQCLRATKGAVEYLSLEKPDFEFGLENICGKC
jgi:hypothetical protein